jgi:hypothetical protein
MFIMPELVVIQAESPIDLAKEVTAFLKTQPISNVHDIAHTHHIANYKMYYTTYITLKNSIAKIAPKRYAKDY